MGYTTDFWGEITVTPALNAAEVEYLNRFAGTRRMNVRQGPFHADPAPDGFGQRFTGDPDVIDANSPPPGQPGLWCQWVPATDGSAIVWDEGEKFYSPAEWMAYLIEEFLKPGATVKQLRAANTNDPVLAGVPEFADHVLNGIIDAQGEDPGDRWRLVVENNAVRTEHAETTWPSDR